LSARFPTRNTKNLADSERFCVVTVAAPADFDRPINFYLCHSN